MPRVSPTSTITSVPPTVSHNIAQQKPHAKNVAKDTLAPAANKGCLTICKDKVLAFIHWLLQCICCFKDKKPTKELEKPTIPLKVVTKPKEEVRSTTSVEEPPKGKPLPPKTEVPLTDIQRDKDKKASEVVPDKTKAKHEKVVQHTQKSTSLPLPLRLTSRHSAQERPVLRPLEEKKSVSDKSAEAEAVEPKAKVSAKDLKGLDLEIFLHEEVLLTLKSQVSDKESYLTASMDLFKFQYALEKGNPEGADYTKNLASHLSEMRQSSLEELQLYMSKHLTLLKRAKAFIDLVLDDKKPGADAIQYLLQHISPVPDSPSRIDRQEDLSPAEQEVYFPDELAELLQVESRNAGPQSKEADYFLTLFREIDSLQINRHRPSFLRAVADKIKDPIAMNVFRKWRQSGVPLRGV